MNITFFLRIYEFSNQQAHGAIVTPDGSLIPFSMPMQAYEQALEKGLFIKPRLQSEAIQSPILYIETPQ